MPDLHKAPRKADSSGRSFDEDFYLKPVKNRKCFRKDVENWEIDKTRLQKLQKLLLINLPQHTVDILSKMVINHQVISIGQVCSITPTCITIKAKVNIEKEVFKELLSEDVRLKIFTKKNHTRPDLEAAEKFTFYVKRDVVVLWPTQKKSACFNVKENMIVHKIDNIVFIDTRTSAKPMLSIQQIVQIDREKAVENYNTLLGLVKKLKVQDSSFWTQPANMHNIFYHDNEWKIFEHKSELPHSSKSFGIFIENIKSMTKAFAKYIPMQKLYGPIYQNFWDNRNPHGFKHKIAVELLRRLR